MVSGRRPIWITRIIRRVSLNTFKKKARQLKGDYENIRMVLTGQPREYVYKVTVETWEGCDDGCPFEDIWVPDVLAEATGEMYEQFEDRLALNPTTRIDTDDDAESEPAAVGEGEEEEVNRVYEAMCDAEEEEKEDDSDSDEESDDVEEDGEM